MNTPVAEPTARAGADPAAAAPAPARGAAEPADGMRAHAMALAQLLDLQAALLEAHSHRDAAIRLVDRLAQFLRCDEVALAFAGDGQLHGLVRSSGAPTEASLPDVRALMAAMHEALDQRTSVVTPPPSAEAVPRIRAAQHRLLVAGAGGVACVLLGPGPTPANETLAPRAPTGVLCAWRRGPQLRPISAAELAWLEHAAAFTAPVFGLLLERERSLRWRLRQRWERRPGARHRWGWLAGALAGGAALAALGLWPVPHEVGGRARVEGAVQRVLVAPAAGFLKQAHVRPGDTVRAGQLLIEMDEQDLLLERERLSGQSVQFETALAEANARADRAQVMIHLARLQQVRAQQALIDTQLERVHLLAPFDAVVVQGDLGQRLGAPLKEGEELVTLAPVGRYRVIVEVDESEIARVQPGQPGSLALAALPWKTLELRVRHVAPMATAAEGRNVFEVEAEVVDPPAELRPGLSGSGRVQVGERGLVAGWASDLARMLQRAWWRTWG